MLNFKDTKLIFLCYWSFFHTNGKYENDSAYVSPHFRKQMHAFSNCSYKLCIPVRDGSVLKKVMIFSHINK